MNVYVNLVPKKKLIKKILILVIFTFLCFFIKEKVFAASEINLYDLTLESEFTIAECSSEFNNYPNFLTEFGFNQYGSLSSSQCPLIVDSFKPYEYIEKAINSGYKYYVISYNHQINYTTNYDYGVRPTIYFFKSIPKLEIIVQVYNKFPTKPHYSTSTSDLTFVDYGNDMLGMSTYKDTVFFTYDFPFGGMIESTIDTQTNEPVEDYIINSFASNFDLYTTDGELLSSASNIIFEIPKDDNSSLFEKIINGILDLPKNIANGIKSFFDTIVNALVSLGNFIIDGIKSLFIPGDELEDFFDEEYEYLKEELGFLIYPIEVFVDFANRVYELGNSTSAVFNIPRLEIFNHTLYDGVSFDLMSIVNENESFKTIYNIYRVAISGFIVLWLVQLAVKKEQEIFGGGSE